MEIEEEQGDYWRVRSRARVEKAREELVCSICMETFKEPRTLACQHTFCTVCLEKLAGSRSPASSGGRTAEKAFSSAAAAPASPRGAKEVTISCPECRANLTLPGSGIHGLPKNFKLERFIEILSPHEREQIKRSSIRRQRKNYCLIHPKKPSEYFCDTCETLACGDCLLETHMNHQGVKRAVEVLPQHVSALRELVPGAKEVLESGETTLNAMQEQSESLEEQGMQAVSNIEAYFGKIRKMLSQRESELKGDVADKLKRGLSRIQQNSAELEVSVMEILKCTREIEEATTLRSESLDVLVREKQLKQRLKTGQENLEECCRVSEGLKKLSVSAPALEDARLEVLCRTLAAKAPTPLPRKRPERPADEKNTTQIHRTDSVASHSYSMTPDIKRVEEIEEEPLGSSNEYLCDPPPPSPPMRNESCDYEVTIIQPESIFGPRNLANSFFRTPTSSIYPRGVCCGVSNTLVVTDVQNHCFRILTLTGKCLDVVGKDGRSDGMFGEPTSIAADMEGNLLVCDLSPARVQKFSPQGKFISKLSGRVFRGSPLGEPWGIAVNYDGKIFVSDWDKSCIHTYDENGHYTGNFGSTNKTMSLKYPAGLAIDKRGRIIVADRGNHVVWIYTPDGQLLSRFGKMGRAPGDLYYPFGVAIDKEGNIFISESGNHRISVFDSDGKFLRSFGKKGTEPGMFHLPRHICIDPQGRLVVCDEHNQRLQIFIS